MNDLNFNGDKKLKKDQKVQAARRLIILFMLSMLFLQGCSRVGRMLEAMSSPPAIAVTQAPTTVVESQPPLATTGTPTIELTVVPTISPTPESSLTPTLEPTVTATPAPV